VKSVNMESKRLSHLQRVFIFVRVSTAKYVINRLKPKKCLKDFYFKKYTSKRIFWLKILWNVI